MSETEPTSTGGPREALLDACEQLLRVGGLHALTTRKVAQEAGVNHGLVHYYFGSMEQLIGDTFERFTDRLIERQRQMYVGDAPFVEKWRAAMQYMDEDLDAGYPKIAAELHTLAMNDPGLAKRLRRVYERWWKVLEDALGAALDEYGIPRSDFPLDAAIAAVFVGTVGVQQLRLVGYARGQAALLQLIDGWLGSLDGRSAIAGGSRNRDKRG